MEGLDFNKAFIVIPHWSDSQSVEYWKTEGYPTYAKTASKAKYDFYLGLEMDEDDWYNYRVLRWKEKDLFKPILHESLECLTENQIDIMKHTYGVESNSPGYRNYFCCQWDDEDFKVLMALDMAERNVSNDNRLSEGSTYFYLTKFGIEVIMSTKYITRENIK